MGAANYVGRVGGLAVALGVGTAVATGHGVASATPDTDSTNSSSTSPQTSPQTTAGTGSPTPATNSVTPVTAPTASTLPVLSQMPAATQSGTTVTSSNSSSTTPTAGQVVSTGGAQTSGKTSETESLSSVPQGTQLTDAKPETLTEPTTVTHSNNLETQLTTTPHSKSDPVSAYDTNTSSRLTINSSAPTLSSVNNLATTLSQPAGNLASLALSSPSPTALTRASTGSVDTLSTPTVGALAPTPVAPSPLTLVGGIVTSILGVFGLGPLAANNAPAAPAQPTMLWGLLAWVRREIEQGVSQFLGGAPAATSPVPTEPANLALASTAPLALAAVANPAPAFPVPGAQLSPSTTFVNWVTGNFPVNNTYDRFGISGTDLGIMWDNGIWDDPTTAAHENEVLIAFGDTFGNHAVPGEEWRNNVLFRSWDRNLSDGISVSDGHYVGTGPESTDIWAGSPLDRTQWLNFQRTFSKQAVPNPNLGPAVTIIPTAGISVPRAGAPFGVMQVISFMAVQQWGAPGTWTTSYSALATSLDNGESWQVAPETVRSNQWWTGNQNFQQSAFVRPGDGFVYVYGTPNGRQGSAYVARVAEQDILDLTKYEYYSAGNPGFFGWGATPAGWYQNNPAAATAIMPPPASAGACGAVSAGNTVSELSVQYNQYLKKYVALYTDQNNSVVMRTADQPQGTWSAATVLLPQQPGGIYAPMMHPWSPSTLGTGSDLYWNLSLWSEYNVMLMKTDLTKV